MIMEHGKSSFKSSNENQNNKSSISIIITRPWLGKRRHTSRVIQVKKFVARIRNESFGTTKMMRGIDNDGTSQGFLIFQILPPFFFFFF